MPHTLYTAKQTGQSLISQINTRSLLSQKVCELKNWYVRDHRTNTPWTGGLDMLVSEEN